MTTRRTATRICTDCKQRPQDMTTIGPELCEVCLEFADTENMHLDYDDPHAEDNGWSLPEAECPVCHPELDTRYEPIVKRKGHTNTATKSHRSHANCNHPVTPKARAACRKAGGPK